MSRYDIVIYGATGFTGTFILGRLVLSEKFEGISFAIAGRSETKLRKVLADVSEKFGKNIEETPIIIADSSDESTLAEMAKKAKVVINAVGPYRLYGEAVVKAAVENGASHVDISGEPSWIEKMQLKYNETAAKNGSYVVSACGWDSIPADLGVNFLKKNFGGDLNHVESFVQMHTGPAGYSLNDGTYQSMILAISEFLTDTFRSVSSEIMPQKIVRGNVGLPKRFILSRIREKELDGFSLPFLGCDESIINRSQYHDATVKNRKPIHIGTYIYVSSGFRALFLLLWASTISLLANISFLRKILQRYPDQTSFNMFKASGPSEQQIKEASFTYWFFGYGYKDQLPFEEQHQGKPDRKVVASCKGPDVGYMATSGCILSSALTIIRDPENLPKEGGVYTTAAAFGESKIYDYLASFGITYQIESESSL